MQPRKTHQEIHDIPITMTQSTSCMGGATPPPHSQQPFTHRHPVLRPECAPHSTDGLNRFGMLQWRRRGKGQRSHSVAHYHSHDINRDQFAKNCTRKPCSTKHSNPHRRLGTPFKSHWLLKPCLAITFVQGYFLLLA